MATVYLQNGGTASSTTNLDQNLEAIYFTTLYSLQHGDNYLSTDVLCYPFYSGFYVRHSNKWTSATRVIVVLRVEEIGNSNNYNEKIILWTPITSGGTANAAGNWRICSYSSNTQILKKEITSKDSYKLIPSDQSDLDVTGNTTSNRTKIPLKITNINTDRIGLFGGKITFGAFELINTDISDFSEYSLENLTTSTSNIYNNVTHGAYGSFYYVYRNYSYNYELNFDETLSHVTFDLDKQLPIFTSGGSISSYDTAISMPSESSQTLRPRTRIIYNNLEVKSNYHFYNNISNLVLKQGNTEKEWTSETDGQKFIIPYITISDLLGGYTDDKTSSNNYHRVYPCTDDFSDAVFKFTLSASVAPEECNLSIPQIHLRSNSLVSLQVENIIDHEFIRESSQHPAPETGKYYYDDIYIVKLIQESTAYRKPKLELDSSSYYKISQSPEAIAVDSNTYKIQLLGNSEHNVELKVSVEYNRFKLQFAENLGLSDIDSHLTNFKVQRKGNVTFPNVDVEQSSNQWTSNTGASEDLMYGDELRLVFKLEPGYSLKITDASLLANTFRYNGSSTTTDWIISNTFSVTQDIILSGECFATIYTLLIHSTPKAAISVEYVPGAIARTELDLDDSIISQNWGIVERNGNDMEKDIYYFDEIDLTADTDIGYTIANIDDSYQNIYTDLTLSPTTVPTQHILNIDKGQITINNNSITKLPNLTITRTNSPIGNGSLTTLTNGATIYYKDEFTINTGTPVEGYELINNGYTITNYDAYADDADITVTQATQLQSWPIKAFYQDANAFINRVSNPYLTRDHPNDNYNGSIDPNGNLPKDKVYYYDNLIITPKIPAGYKLKEFTINGQNQDDDIVEIESLNYSDHILHGGNIQEALYVGVKAKPNGFVMLGQSIHSNNFFNQNFNFVRGWKLLEPDQNNSSLQWRYHGSSYTNYAMLRTSNNGSQLPLYNNIEIIMDIPGYEWCIISSTNNPGSGTNSNKNLQNVVYHTTKGNYQSTLMGVQIFITDYERDVNDNPRRLFVSIKRTDNGTLTDSDIDLINSHLFYNIIPFQKYLAYIWTNINNEPKWYPTIPYIYNRKNDNQLNWYQCATPENSLILKQGRTRFGLDAYSTDEIITLPLKIPAVQRKINPKVTQLHQIKTINGTKRDNELNLESEYHNDINLNRVTIFQFEDSVLNLPFDSPQLLYSTKEVPLQPGYYWFELENIAYTFFLYTTIPAHTGFRVSEVLDEANTRQIIVYDADKCTVVQQHNLITNASFGTQLTEFNDLDKSLYGDSDYKSSWIYAWLNSADPIFTGWGTSDYSRPIDYNLPGFLALNSNWDAVIGRVKAASESDSALHYADLIESQRTIPSSRKPCDTFGICPQVYFI